MPSLGSIFSIASSALRAQQQGLDVAGHNIANANTEGYSRQRPSLIAQDPLRTAEGVFGTGVTLDDVQRIRDVLLDRSVRTRRGEAARSGTRSDYLARVETLLGEPGDAGIGGALDRLFSSFSDLATSPTSAGARTVVRSRGRELVRSFTSLDDALGSLRQQAESRLGDDVRRANGLLEQISVFNEEIVTAEADGTSAPDLRDDRARVLDALSDLIDVSVTHRGDGSVGVQSDGRSLVDGSVHGILEVSTGTGTLELKLKGDPSPLSGRGGSIGGGMVFLNDDLATLRKDLDALASAVVTDINALHRTGVNPDGVSEPGFDGVAFFDAAGTTAGSIALSASVDSSEGAIAAGTPDSAGDYRPGANDVALAIADLRQEASPTLGSSSLGERYRTLVGDVGVKSRDVADQADFQEKLQDRAEKRRLSLSGVSTDEELVRIIRFQTAYQAAARVVTTADQMLQSLLAM